MRKPEWISKPTGGLAKAVALANAVVHSLVSTFLDTCQPTTFLVIQINKHR